MDKMAKPSTCGRCRTKKIRCDGQDPCGPCSKSRVHVVCSYVVPTISHGPELRKGAACSACRRKKKKCSGDWPCRTCVASKKEDDCKYDDGSQLSFTRALIERTFELEQLLSEAKQSSQQISGYAVSSDLSAELDQLLSSNPLPPAEAIFLGQDTFFNESVASTPMSVSVLPEENGFSFLDTSYSPAASAALNPPVPVPTPVPPVPVVETQTEKLFRLRKLFLAKRVQFGFVLTAHKLTAVTNGDVSGTVVHPVLVHVAHLWGYMFDYYQKYHTWIYAPDKNADEVAQMRLILGGLAGMLGPAPDPVTTLNTYIAVALYFFHRSDISRALEFLSVASNHAMTHDLDLAAVASIPAEEKDKNMFSLYPLNDAGELRSAFSNLIRVAVAAQVTLSTPSVVDTRLMDKFDLLLSTQVKNNVDINFLHAKSLRLLTLARQLTTTWNNGQSPPASWFDQYWKLVEQLHAHIAVLSPMQFRISFIPDAHTTELALKLCSTMSLTALADLHGIFAPSHPESTRRYRDAVVEIVSITSTFSLDDCQYLDPILPLCWSVATKRILQNEVVYDNQRSIIEAIRGCNHNLRHALPFVVDFETNVNDNALVSSS